MKYGRLRTLRGQLTVVGGVARKNVIVSDGLVNLGLKINRFQIWPENGPTGGSDVTFTGILSLDTIPSGSAMNASDNRQFAWNFFSVKGPTAGPPAGSPSVTQPTREILDPDHIVNRDLFLTMHNTSDQVYNYLIEAQVVELSDDEAIITIIKETSQT